MRDCCKLCDSLFLLECLSSQIISSPGFSDSLADCRWRFIYVEKPVFLDGNIYFYMYFASWDENPEYEDFIVVRDYETGEVKSIEKGSIFRMQNGEMWKI